MLEQLYSYLGPAAARRGPAWRRFLLETGPTDEQLGSHLTRAEATAAVKAFYRPEVAAEIGASASLDRLRARAAAGFGRWSRLERAAWLELTTLLEPYLLSAQGDRVAMAHGVEGRFPFLDHRVFAYSARAAGGAKLDGMREKVALRELAADLLPPEIAERAQAAVPGAGGRSLLRARRARVGRGAALAGGAGRDGDLGRGARRRACCGAAAPAARPGCARRWRSWASSPRSSGIGSSWARGRRAYPPETAEPRVRIDRTVEPADRGGCMTEAQRASARTCGRTSRRTSSTSIPASRSSDGDDFLTLGIVDSLGFVELVEEVQSRYGVTVDDVEITEENFGSIDAIADFVERKRSAA